jgi:predicted regulator of Ras-like GTPase activity (Roadblock/LC7/MglB family)
MRDILKSSVTSVEGALASVVMGFDGVPVEQFVQDGAPVDIETLGVEYSNALTEVRRTADALSSGSVQEVAVVTEGALVLLRPVNGEYFVALVMTAEGNLGKGRFVLKRAARALAQEM